MVGRHNILCYQKILYRNWIFQYTSPHFPANLTTFRSQFTIKCLGSGQKPIFFVGGWGGGGDSALPQQACLCCFYFSPDLIQGVPFPFGVKGRMWNSIVSVPDHCLFIYFTYFIRYRAFEPWLAKVELRLNGNQSLKRLKNVAKTQPFGQWIQSKTLNKWTSFKADLTMWHWLPDR